jgi:hypothetical protein
MGKSTIAREIQRRLGADNTVILEVESCLMSRSERIKAGLSSCSAKAFDHATYQSMAKQLLDGHEVAVPGYAHSWTSSASKSVTAVLPSSGCLILVGVHTATGLLDIHRDLCLAFLPSSPRDWLRFADQRDRCYRGYTSGSQAPDNKPKLKLIGQALQASRALITHTIVTEIGGNEQAPTLSYRVHPGADDSFLSALSLVD